MRLLIKWLRPETAPSPKRKNIPFGTRLRLSLYRECLKILRNWHQKYAFSDTVVISGRPAIRICHEYRDIDFESELKRLRLPLQDDMVERQGTSSSQSEKSKRRTYYNCFHLKDPFVLDISGQRIAIDHGDGRAIVSTVKGMLKESDAANLVSKFFFVGNLRDDKMSRNGGEIRRKLIDGQKVNLTCRFIVESNLKDGRTWFRFADEGMDLGADAFILPSILEEHRDDLGDGENWGNITLEGWTLEYFSEALHYLRTQTSYESIFNQTCYHSSAVSYA